MEINTHKKEEIVGSQKKKKELAFKGQDSSFVPFANDFVRDTHNHGSARHIIFCISILLSYNLVFTIETKSIFRQRDAKNEHNCPEHKTKTNGHPLNTKKKKILQLP